MTEYANFDMPVWFKGTIPEALAVRSAVERGIPRAGYEIKSGETVVSKVTSGIFSPLLNYGIAMGYVPPE